MGSVTLTGMVLSSSNIDEADKRLVILTKERGKITAFVKGAKRPQSPLAAASNPFCFGTFTAYEGKNYHITRAEISNYFTEISADYDKVCLGSYFLEVAAYESVENVEEKERLLLLFCAIRELAKDKMPRELIRDVYELRSMAISGEYPNVFACVNCGRKDLLSHFAMGLRGCLCPDCSNKLGGVMIEKSVLYAMQYIITSPMNKLFSFELKPEVLEELTRIISGYRLNFDHHKYKTLEFLQ